MVCAGQLGPTWVLEMQTREKKSGRRRRRRRRRLRLECNSICCFPLVVIIKRFVVVGFNICIWQSRVSLLWSPLSPSLSLLFFLYSDFFGGTTRLFLLLCYTLFLLLLNNNFWFLVFLRRRHQGPGQGIELQDYTTTKTTRLDPRQARGYDDDDDDGGDDDDDVNGSRGSLCVPEHNYYKCFFK